MSSDLKTIVGCHALVGTAHESAAAPVDIVISGERITAVRPAGETAPQGEVIDGRDRLVAPGLVNGHIHSHENFHKGRYEKLPLELMMNYVRPPRPLPLTARHVYLRTLIGAIEALKSGTTTLVDDMNVYPVLHSEHVDAALDAYRDVGIRAYLGTTLFDLPFHQSVPFVEEVFPSEALRKLQAGARTSAQEILAFARTLAARYDATRDRVSYIMAPSAPHRCSPAFLRECFAIAEEFDTPIIMHVQETRPQVVTGEVLHGKSLIRYLGDLGLLNDRLALIHAVHIDAEEIALIAASGASVQHCVNANLRLGSGLAPVRELLDAGINVCLGGDGMACTDTGNILELMGTVAKVHNLRGPGLAKAVTARETWAAATMGGARALRRGADLGAIEAGRIADLVSFRLDRIQYAPRGDLLRQLVYAERGQNIDMVMVNGSVVVRNGTLQTIDESSIVSEINEAYARLLPEIEASEAAVDTFTPSYRKIYCRCMTHPVSHRYLPNLICTES